MSEHWFDLDAQETKWYLPTCIEKVEFYEREEIPEDLIKLMNGERVKVTLNTKGWKMCYGSCE